MKRFCVEIPEVYYQLVYVNAETEAEALEKARQYNNGTVQEAGAVDDDCFYGDLIYTQDSPQGHEWLCNEEEEWEDIEEEG